VYPIPRLSFDVSTSVGHLMAQPLVLFCPPIAPPVSNLIDPEYLLYIISHFTSPSAPMQVPPSQKDVLPFGTEVLVATSQLLAKTESY